MTMGVNNFMANHSLTNQLSVKIVKKEAFSEDGSSVDSETENKFKLKINHCFVEELCTCEI